MTHVNNSKAFLGDEICITKMFGSWNPVYNPFQWLSICVTVKLLEGSIVIDIFALTATVEILCMCSFEYHLTIWIFIRKNFHQETVNEIDIVEER